MKSWVIAAIFVSMGALAACDSGDGGDGAGGSGGDTGEGGSTSSSTDTATDTGTGTGTGTDTGTAEACAEEDAASTECSQDSACGTCAVAAGGPCNTEFNACATNPECVTFVTCLGMCAPNDATCEEACVTDAGGDDAEPVALYDEAQFCVICNACPVSCEADMEPNCTP